MSYQYDKGTVRWRRYSGPGDVRSYCASRGLTAQAVLVDIHPITSMYLGRSEWWIKETRK